MAENMSLSMIFPHLAFNFRRTGNLKQEALDIGLSPGTIMIDLRIDVPISRGRHGVDGV